jgi:hypothetical protein
MQTSPTDVAENGEHPIVDVAAKDLVAPELTQIPEELIELPTPETLQVIEDQLNAVNKQS